MWDATKLPFLEEKLSFREKFIESSHLCESSRVLCLFGGNESKLTLFYAGKFQEVVAVDKNFSVALPQNVIILNCSVEKALYELAGQSFDIVDIDPFGSSAKFIPHVFRFKNVKALLITDGLLTCLHFHRKVNLFKHYRVGENVVKKHAEWAKKWFECIVFSYVAREAELSGYSIVKFDAERNRYGLALYAGFVLSKNG